MKRSRQFNNLLALCLAVGIAGVTVSSQAFAEQKYERVYNASAHRYEYIPQKSLAQKTKDAFKNPIVKQSAVGAAVGLGAGMLSREGSPLKGAGIGALVGAGTGLMDTSTTLKNKPLLKSTAKGALIGTGAGAVMGTSKLKGAALGAAAGAGAHFIKDYMDTH
jgi:hypothetical protein